MRPITSLVANPPHVVSKLITANAEWDEARMNEVFLPTDASAIIAIPLCTRHVDDFWSWIHERNCIFIVRSAYRMLVTTKLRLRHGLKAGPTLQIQKAR